MHNVDGQLTDAPALLRSCAAPTLGFVVIGRNEGERLRRCLASLAHFQALLIYVDSASTDGSAELAAAVGAHVVNLDLTRPFTAARARNEGAARLRELAPEARFIQFLDGDCELSPGWLETALSFMKGRPDVAIVCGRRSERDPDHSIYNRLCDIEWDTPIGEAQACGGDALVRIEPFVAVDGFDDRLTAGEEPELCARLRGWGWKVWRINECMTLHDAHMSRFKQWWLRAVRSGYGYAQVFATTRSTPQPLYGRELRRAAVWGAGFPLAGLTAIIAWPKMGILAVGVLIAQVARIAARRGVNSFFSWQYALFMVLSKVPELLGALRFVRSGTHRPESSIVYK